MSLSSNKHQQQCGNDETNDFADKSALKKDEVAAERTPPLPLKSDDGVRRPVLVILRTPKVPFMPDHSHEVLHVIRLQKGSSTGQVRVLKHLFPVTDGSLVRWGGRIRPVTSWEKDHALGPQSGVVQHHLHIVLTAT